MKKPFFLSLALACCLYGTAQTEVASYQPGITAEGVIYFLPVTGVRVVVTATKTRYTPGEYCDYAERFLRLKDVTSTPYDEWKIDKIEMVSFGRADKTKAFTIKVKPKTVAPLVGLAPDGRLLTVNAEIKENEAPLPSPSVTPIKEATINGADFKTEEILAAGSKTKMAELTAGEIADIRENRSLLTKGQADFMPKDGEQLRLMLSSLERQEEGLLQLFRGTQSRETHVFVFDVEAVKEQEKAELFRFSKYLGVVDEDDPAGEPIYLSLKDLKTLPAVTVDPEAKKKKETEDLRYIVPSRVEIKVFNDTHTFATETFPMAQFGRVEHLGGDLFNKKYATRVFLSPTTGGLLRLDADRPE